MSAPATTLTPSNWKPKVNPWIIAAAVMLPTFMEVLDTAIANVALPYIAGGLGVSNEEATWVLTSYLVSNAIILPSTAWLSGFFGRRRFLLMCIVIFVSASALCGLAMNLEWIIIARILQGIGGGGLMPLSQAILLESFPPEKRGAGMAVFALGVVVAPALGPVMGGWITYDYSWRWIFYINIPVGILALFMVHTFVEDPPYLKKPQGRIDYWGLAFLSLWIGTMQPILDKGQQDDWFGATWICIFTVISILSFFTFIIWELNHKNPVVNLRIFKNRNFTVGILLMALMGATLYALITLAPLYLQDLMGYTAYLAGLATSPRGVGAFLFSAILGRLTGIIDSRILIAVGFACLVWSTLWLGNINLNIGIWNYIWPMFIGGVGTVCVFVPLSTATFSTLKQNQIGNASGIFNLMRNLGGSIGISIVITMLQRGTQRHQSYLVKNLIEQNSAYWETIQKSELYLTTKFTASTAAEMAQGLQYSNLVQQATLWAFVDDFRWLAGISLIGIPLAFFFKKPKGGIL